MLTDIFISLFVVIALLFITIKAWFSVVRAVGVKISDKEENRYGALVMYTALALVITAVSILILWYANRNSDIDMYQRPIRVQHALEGLEMSI